MAHVDSLSQAPLPITNVELEIVTDKVMRISITPTDWVASLQFKDQYLIEIKDSIDKGEPRYTNGFEMIGGRLFKKTINEPRDKSERAPQSG